MKGWVSSTSNLDLSEQCNISHIHTVIAWKVSLFGIFPVRNFPHSHEYGEMRSISVQMQENTDQKNSKYGQFLFT